MLDVPNVGQIEVSIIDAANPLVFVKAKDLGLKGTELPNQWDSDEAVLQMLESVRGMAAVKLGLADDYTKSPWSKITKIESFEKTALNNVGIGSVIYAKKPGDGSAREQAASCQKVLGGWANISKEYATKRYRSNLINWGMIPFILQEEPMFKNDSYIFIPNISQAVKNGDSFIKAYALGDETAEFTLEIGELTNDERQIILDGSLINYYRNNN